MSDLAVNTTDSDAVSSPTATSRPPNPTKNAAQPNPTQTYPPRTAETPGSLPAEAYPASPAAGNTSAETAKRSSNSRHFTRIWRVARLQALAVLGAAVVGIAFGHVVAGNDPRMQIFLSATVGMGLFFPFSALAPKLNRKR